MVDGTGASVARRPPTYWVLLVVALAMFGLSWLGERQEWSSTVTLVLTLGGTAILATDALVFRRNRER